VTAPVAFRLTTFLERQLDGEFGREDHRRRWRGASERHRRESPATGGASVVILDTVQADGRDVAAATGATFHEMDGPHGLDSFRATIDLNLMGSRLPAGR
jgi:hypothetical protein